MSLTPDELLADVALVYTGNEAKGAYGSGRLIAPGLVLTAGHVVDYPTRNRPRRKRWKVCLLKERSKSGAWTSLAHEATLLWRAAGDLDLALLLVCANTKLTPTLQPVFVSYDVLGSILEVNATGFPEAWFTETGMLRDYTVPGNLRIAAQLGPYGWTVALENKPDDPSGWKGMSGAAVCYVGQDDKLYVFGVVEEVPANFPGGLLQVARISHGFADAVFVGHLRAALGEEPSLVAWSGDSSKTPRPVSSEQAPADYVERPELTAPLLAHLLVDEPAPKGRAIISAVHGMGGIGKTTIASWLIRRPEVEQRFPDGRIWITLGEEPQDDALKIINDRMSQLDSAFKAKATEQVARDELAALLHSRSIVFVIDDVWPGQSAEIAKALIVPSPRSRFLLTSRFRLSELTDDRRLEAKEFELYKMSIGQGTELIVSTLGRELSGTEKALVEQLCEAVDGHPLALVLAAARIKRGRPWDVLLEDLTVEIARLEVLDKPARKPETNLAKRRQNSVVASLMLSVRDLSRFEQQLFAWLGVVFKDATITPSMCATLWSTAKWEALEYLGDLASVGLLSAREDAYRLHHLMHDVALKLLTGPDTRAREGDIPGFGCTLRDAHQQFLERYRAKVEDGPWHALPDDGYIYDHLLRHFEHADWERELEQILREENADGLCGWYECRGGMSQTAGFLSDVYRGWRYADRTFAVATDEEQRGQALALQLHCALIIASINSLSAVIPTEVLVGAVRCELMEWSAALALARQRPSTGDRVAALAALASTMPPAEQQEVLSEALNAARGIKDAKLRARALAELVQRLPAGEQLGLLDEALTAAQSITDSSHTQFITTLIELLPARKALAVVDSIDNESWWRAETLTKLARRFPAEERSSVLHDALTAAREASRAETLVKVAQELPAEERPSVLHNALTAARGIDEKASRAETLVKVAQALPAEEQPSVLGEAWAVARGIVAAPHSLDRLRRAQALARVAQRLPAEQQASAFEEALTAAQNIDRAGWRATALRDVAQLLPGVEGLTVARSIDDAPLRARALAGVARRLPIGLLSTAVREAMTAARGIDSAEERGRTLAIVVELLAGTEAPLTAADIDGGELRKVTGVEDELARQEALVVARGIDEGYWRALALWVLARQLPTEGMLNVLHEALGVARGIDDRPLLKKDPLLAFSYDTPRVQKKQLLAALAQELAGGALRLPVDQQRSVLREALSAAHGFDDIEPRARALAEIAKLLPGQEALAIARDLSDLSMRARALMEASRRLPPKEQGGVIDEALTAARGIADAESRAFIMGEVAQRLPPEKQPSVLGEALNAARTTPRWRWYGRPPSAELPKEEQWRWFAVPPPPPPAPWAALEESARSLPAKDALPVARSVPDPLSRSRSLVKVALRLPPEEQASVLREALTAARQIDNAILLVELLVQVGHRLPAAEQSSVLAEALSTARNVVDPCSRAQALAQVAHRLPVEEQSSVLSEALIAARSVDDAASRVWALTLLAQRLPESEQESVFWEALTVAPGIDDADSRARALAAVAQPVGAGQFIGLTRRKWIDISRVLSTRRRSECVGDFTAILPLIQTLGGNTALQGFRCSIASVGRWWG
jgi:hypothetical protein